MELNNLKTILATYPAFRTKQAEEAVFRNFIADWQESNLPQDLKTILNQECPLSLQAETQTSKDGKTIKALIKLDDGGAIETVLMRHQDGRNTVCVSSQVGCALGCAFCATGRGGFQRNLTYSEITDQVLFFARILKKEKESVTNIVFMGMGEPLLSYSEVLAAIKILNDKNKFNIGARKISISTVGIIDGIKKLTVEPLQINLAISLHAPSDKLRSLLMPVNKKYPLKKLLKTVAEYINRTNRRVMIEYLMLENVNDSSEQAVELAELLKNSLPHLFFINLISYNPTGGFEPSAAERIEKFQKVLKKHGLESVQRYKFGVSIKGACGQLANRVIGERKNK